MNALFEQQYRASSKKAALDFQLRGFDFTADQIYAATVMYKTHIASLPRIESELIGNMCVVCVSPEGGQRSSPAISFKGV